MAKHDIHRKDSDDSSFAIAAVTMCRGDIFFLERWIDYYGKVLGREHLYILVDGENEPLPCNAEGVNIDRRGHHTLSRARGDKYRIGELNRLSERLFASGYQAVIGIDCDEFLVVDPRLGLTLRTFLQKEYAKGRPSISALGIDLGQNLDEESPLDHHLPFLLQRSFGVLSSRYTKASVKFDPERRWGSGFHRIKGHNYHIVPGFYLIHTGYCCQSFLQGRFSDDARLRGGWERHLGRRGKTIVYTTQKKAYPADKLLSLARFLQQFFRQPFAWNKPLMPFPPIVIKLPDRFRSIAF